MITYLKAFFSLIIFLYGMVDNDFNKTDTDISFIYTPPFSMPNNTTPISSENKIEINNNNKPKEDLKIKAVPNSFAR